MGGLELGENDESNSNDNANNNVVSAVVEELAAIQPNLHNGAKHLMSHVDWPRHEGFGKVIATIAVVGSATIVLTDPNEEDPKTGQQQAWKFRVEQGEAYILSGN